jgi:hypothetical protein
VGPGSELSTNAAWHCLPALFHQSSCTTSQAKATHTALSASAAYLNQVLLTYLLLLLLLLYCNTSWKPTTNSKLLCLETGR